MGIKQKIENNFSNLAGFIFQNHKLILGLLAIVFICLVGQLYKVSIDTSNEGFLHEDDPIRQNYKVFKKQFGRDDYVILAIEVDDVFTIPNLEKLRALHKDLAENVPHIDDITSLLNVRNTWGEADILHVDEFLETWPQNAEDLAILKKRAMENRFYRNLFISEDGTIATVLIKIDVFKKTAPSQKVGIQDGFDIIPGVSKKQNLEMLGGSDDTRIVAAVDKVMKRHQVEGFKIYHAGSPLIGVAVKDTIMRDMAIFMMLTLSIIGTSLFLMFRNRHAVIMPLVTVMVTMLSTVGLMTGLGCQIKPASMILPSFLIAVAIGDSIHLLAIFFQNLRKGLDKEEAIRHAMGHCGIALTITSLTTAAGLASFSTAEVSSIASLGLFSAVGVLIALFYTILLLPALISFFDINTNQALNETSHHKFWDGILDSIVDMTIGHPKLILVISLSLIVISTYGASQLKFSHDVVAWLKKDLPARMDTEKLDQAIKGTGTVDIVVDTGVDDGWHNRENLLKLEKLTAEIEKIDMGNGLFVGKVFSIVDVLKETNKALHANDQAYYTIPENQKLIPQEFFLFENTGSDDLEDFVDSNFRFARFTIKTPWKDALYYIPFMEDIKQRFEKEFGISPEVLSAGEIAPTASSYSDMVSRLNPMSPQTTHAAMNSAKASPYSIMVTGMIPMFTKTIHAAMNSASKSYTIAFLVITAMMIMLLGPRIGLISMLPNLAPIIMGMGLIHLIGMQLDLFTMLVASITLGLAVDDTVHFLHNFQRYYDNSGKVEDAIRKTMQSSGRAMVVTSVVLSLGFFTFMFASMENLFYFGLITGITILLALLADMIMTPALMILITKDKEVKAH